MPPPDQPFTFCDFATASNLDVGLDLHLELLQHGRNRCDNIRGGRGAPKSVATCRCQCWPHQQPFLQEAACKRLKGTRVGVSVDRLHLHRSVRDEGSAMTQAHNNGGLLTEVRRATRESGEGASRLGVAESTSSPTQHLLFRCDSHYCAAHAVCRMCHHTPHVCFKGRPSEQHQRRH